LDLDCIQIVIIYRPERIGVWAIVKCHCWESSIKYWIDGKCIPPSWWSQPSINATLYSCICCGCVPKPIVAWRPTEWSTPFIATRYTGYTIWIWIWSEEMIF
jgi:hypothetical protein